MWICSVFHYSYSFCGQGSQFESTLFWQFPFSVVSFLDSTVGRSGWYAFFLCFCKMLNFSLFSFFSSGDALWRKAHICISDSLPKQCFSKASILNPSLFQELVLIIYSIQTCVQYFALTVGVSLSVGISPKPSEPFYFFFFHSILSLPHPCS